MRATSSFAVVGLVIASLLSGGCSRGPTYYSIRGVVTIDGQPHEGIQVSFLPADPAKPTASGVTDALGRFRLLSGSHGTPGVQKGPHKVVFSAGAAAEMAPEFVGPQARRLDDPTDSGTLRLAPDTPTPPFALEYCFSATTPLSFRVSEKAEANFDLLPLGAKNVPPPTMAGGDSPPAAQAEAEPTD
jgi:hypothetical protein